VVAQWHLSQTPCLPPQFPIAETIAILVDQMINRGHRLGQIIIRIAIIEEVVETIVVTIVIFQIEERIGIRTEIQIEIEESFLIEIDIGRIVEISGVLIGILITEMIQDINDAVWQVMSH